MKYTHLRLFNKCLHLFIEKRIFKYFERKCPDLLTIKFKYDDWNVLELVHFVTIERTKTQRTGFICYVWICVNSDITVLIAFDILRDCNSKLLYDRDVMICYFFKHVKFCFRVTNNFGWWVKMKLNVKWLWFFFSIKVLFSIKHDRGNYV